MSGEGRGDDVYQPDPSDVGNRPTDDLDLENAIGERNLDDIMDEGYSPPERPLGVTKYGTTGEEQQEGESLDQRLAQEEPDTGAGTKDGAVTKDGAREEPESNGPVEEDAGTQRSGRLTEVDDPGPSRNDDVLARDVGIDAGAASAEEAAMHTTDDDESTR